MTDFVKAEAGIRQLHARCADAVWRKDAAAFGDCFAKDGEWRIAGLVMKGRDHIGATFGQIMTRFERVLMTFRTPILEVGPGIASGRTYVTEQTAIADGTRALAISTYFERFVEDGDRWLFTWRLFQLHYMGPADLSGTYFDNVDYGAPPAMPALDAMSVDHSGLGTRNC